MPSTASTRTPPRRVRLLFAWFALLTVLCSAIWLTGTSQDYKNTALQVAVALAVLGLSIWTIRSSGLPRRQRRLLALAEWAPILMVLPPLGPIELINNGNNGITGWRWRWGAKPDERLAEIAGTGGQTIEIQTTEHDYPRFLGTGYWAEVENVQLDPDWNSSPPKRLWRQPIGAGWSGWAVVGDYAITQEQRGEQELVVCYNLRTGKPAWSHSDEARWDPGGGGALGGVGPRATPTIHEGRVYTQGATGIVNCLYVATGKRIWSRDTLREYDAPSVLWGKAGSPLILDDAVVISVGGNADNSLVAFALADGKERWSAGNRRSAYATPVLTELAGQRQILIVNEDALTAHNADDGEVLWEHPWPGNSDSNATASQPVPVGDDRVLLSKGYGQQAQLIKVKQSDDGTWTAEIQWENPVMRTKMGNVVVRDGYVYGIDDVDLECIKLDTGKRMWKKRRRPALGHGQIILVGDVILVLSESGEVVLVEASPKKFTELAAMPAIEGVTWNNPALAGPYLLVRNAEQAACFKLPLRDAAQLARRNDLAPGQ